MTRDNVLKYTPILLSRTCPPELVWPVASIIPSQITLNHSPASMSAQERHPLRWQQPWPVSHSVPLVSLPMITHDNASSTILSLPDTGARITPEPVQAWEYTNLTDTDNVTGYCVTQCTNNTFADPSTKRCVDICPDQPLMYTKTLL